ncbi:MAG TPA: RidA family protein [Candidatus Thermoplasmatota archaeon]|nr:RidA family protein [Candidatus Thermoplasmatota archaeon]
MVTPVEAPALGKAIGYAHGMRAGGLVFTAGQIGATGSPEGALRVVSPDLAEQFEKALENVVEVVRAAGGEPGSIAEMTVYVTDMEAYRAKRKEIGAAWRRHLGRHFPAMTLVAVTALVEPEAKVEIRAVAKVE